MCRTSKRRDLLSRLRPATDEAGFTLVELLASLTLFALCSSAAISMFVTGMRASLVVRLDTGAKALTQERIEIMRNLTYHIAYAASPAANPPDFLDTYYRTSLTPAGPISGPTIPGGYVGPTSTGASYRLEGEPATGAFYRKVLAPVDADFPEYSQYIATQFINSSGTAVTPPSGYNSQALSPTDDAPSSFVAITITTRWQSGKLSKSYTIQSRLSDGQPSAARASIQGRMAALEVKTSVDPTTELLVGAGTLSLDASMTTGGQASAVVRGAYADLPADRIDGAVGELSVPPAASSISDSENPLDLDDSNGNLVAGFGATEVDDVSAAVTGGLPSVATSTTPVSSLVGNSTTGPYSLKVSNNPSGRPELQLDPVKPQVFIHNGGGSAASATGYLATTSGAAKKVTTGLTAQTRVISVLPTTFAPDGVVKVKLVAAAIECVSSGSAPSVTGTYSAEVSYWAYSPTTGTSGYTTLSLGSASTTQLSPTLLSTVQVGFAPDGVTPLFLDDYITSWARVASIPALSGTFSGGDGVQLDVAGLVSVETAPTRLDPSLTDDPLTPLVDERLDTTSTIGLQVGAVSCVALDAR